MRACVRACMRACVLPMQLYAREGYEYEVERLRHIPRLPARVHERSDEDMDEHNNHSDNGRQRLGGMVIFTVGKDTTSRVATLRMSRVALILVYILAH